MSSAHKHVHVLGAAALALAAVACGSSSPTNPTPTPAPQPANIAPVIGQMAASQSAYRTGRLTANATDSDGQISSANIDWGDGTTTPLTTGFASISQTHRYARAQSYTITLRATDDKGTTAQSTRSVTITVPPEACLGILVIELCARSTSDFKNLQVAAKAGDIVLAGITVTDGNPSIAMPLAAGFGRLTLSHNFTSGRLTISGEVCPVPFLVCDSVGSRVIQF